MSSFVERTFKKAKIDTKKIKLRSENCIVQCTRQEQIPSEAENPCLCKKMYHHLNNSISDRLGLSKVLYVYIV